MTANERVQALSRFGYSEPEGTFLCLAALHGGYFLRRQYASFIGGKDGGNVTQLVQKALAQGHLRSSTWRQNTQLYHLCARPFYEALGQGENRNRRTREVLTIKNRVMGFDFVLAHGDVRYLATEQEKLDYFTGTLNLKVDQLPAKLYRSRKSSSATTRYFLEKYPLFLSPAREESSASSPPVVSFCFVDEGMVSLSRFESYLRNYRSLFNSLPGFRLVYIAAKNRHFESAQRIFENFIESDSGLPTATRISRTDRLIQYFEVRRLYESGQLESFDRAKLLRLRQERAEFSSAKQEMAYARWKAGGPDSEPETLKPETAAQPLILGAFSTFLLEHNYDLFGNFPG